MPWTLVFPVIPLMRRDPGTFVEYSVKQEGSKGTMWSENPESAIQMFDVSSSDEDSMAPVTRPDSYEAIWPDGEFLETLPFP